ncbi:cadherin-like beta sandwich domain-containing protein [Brevibacillus dissolubilis]|uniref:cadherin-like beta sandwich domain-containing protein n=1 Tax=Brevibacillus dissolubilis TaxID=1844116 RepID=UPI001115CDB5|nr:cadherin-like beta sandwich domain-containing protein [Brevibacillus dissolubilis]
MKKRLKHTTLVMGLVASICIPTLSPYYSAPVYAAAEYAKEDQTRLPIAAVTPQAGAEGVRPDASIQLTLDAADKNFARFRNQLERGAYELSINGQAVPSSYDKQKQVIQVEPGTLPRYSTITVSLSLKADMQNDQNSSNNATFTYSFETGSALHEATHLEVNVPQSKVRVTETAELHVKVTDDYGLPANARVHIESESVNVQADTLELDSDDQGQGIIEVSDHVKETVALKVISEDTEYQDEVDTRTAEASVEFIAGLPDHLRLEAASPLVVGGTEVLSGTVYDLYDNPVENDTIVTATATAGQVTPQEQQTEDGAFAFQFVAPTKVQDVVLTAQSGDAKGQITVELHADQPAHVAMEADNLNPTTEEASTIRMTITDQYGNPVPNADVTLHATGNAMVTGTVRTDVNGQAVVQVTDKTAESVVVTATTANGVSGSTTILFGDTTAPAATVDLTAGGATGSAVTLNWTAPGDDEMTGTAATYDIRYSTQPITEENWSEAARVTTAPAPAQAGTKQTTVVQGLTGNILYYFALKTTDEAGNQSRLSNIAEAKTIISNNADLKGLTTSQGTLSPAFASAVTGYTTSVDNGVTSVSVTPVLADETATVTVNGTAVTNGQASQPINLNVGTTLITVTVTAQNGNTKTYTISVTRKGVQAKSVSISQINTDGGVQGYINYGQGRKWRIYRNITVIGTAYDTMGKPAANASVTVSVTVRLNNRTFQATGTADANGRFSIPISGLSPAVGVYSYNNWSSMHYYDVIPLSVTSNGVSVSSNETSLYHFAYSKYLPH